MSEEEARTVWLVVAGCALLTVALAFMAMVAITDNMIFMLPAAPAFVGTGYVASAVIGG